MTHHDHKRAQLRARIVDVMTQPAFDGASQKQIADAVGIHPKTLRNYLTEELWEQIKTKRLEVVTRTLDQQVAAIDRAILDKALNGDLQAAKLVYARWDMLRAERGENTPASLNEIEAELKRLEDEISALERKTA